MPVAFAFKLGDNESMEIAAAKQAKWNASLQTTKVAKKAQHHKHSAPGTQAAGESGELKIPAPPPEEVSNGPAPEFGPGWTVKKFKRMGGATKNRVDRYWYSPGGNKFRSKLEISRFKTALVAGGGEDEAKAWLIFKNKPQTIAMQ